MKRQTNIPCPGRWQCDSKLNKTGKSIQTYSNLFVLGSDSKNQTKNVAPRLRSNKVENDAWQSKPLRCFFRFARLQRCKQGRLLKVTCRVYTDAISQNIPNFTKLHLKWDQWSNTIRHIWYITAKQTCVLHSKALNTMNPMNHETWAQGLLLLFLFHIVCHVLNCWPPTLITQHSSTLCQPTCQSIEVKVFQHLGCMPHMRDRPWHPCVTRGLCQWSSSEGTGSNVKPFLPA